MALVFLSYRLYLLTCFLLGGVKRSGRRLGVFKCPGADVACSFCLPVTDQDKVFRFRVLQGDCH